MGLLSAGRAIFLGAALFGCSSASTPAGAPDAQLDGSSSDGSAESALDGGSDDTMVSDQGADDFQPDLGAEAPAGGCFATSKATVDTCKTACKPYDTCPAFSFGGNCASGCPTRSAIMQKCAEGAGGSCAALEACVRCSVACDKAAECGQPAGPCCANCVDRPACYDPSLPICDAIKKSVVGCPPKMM